MRNVSCTVKPYSQTQTRKALLDAVKRINAGETGVDVDVDVSDPFGMGYGTAGIRDLLTLPGTQFQVSNAKRSWFAVVRAEGGKLKVA